jgi:glycosyltransferase involved in cell wall biosynthesis
MKNGRVSVIITTKNRKNYLKQAIDSVLSQTYKNIEIIIVNDGSDDGTADYLKKFLNNEKILIITNETSMGANYCRNLGIRNSKGDYLAFLDDDDFWDKDKLKKQVQLIESNEKIGLVSTGFYLVDDNGKVNRVFRRKNETINSRNAIDRLVLEGNFIGGFSFPLIRSNIVKKYNITLDNKLKSYQDLIFYLDLLQYVPHVAMIEEPLVYYRKHTKGQIKGDYKKLIQGVESAINYLLQYNFNDKYVKKFKKNTYLSICYETKDNRTFKEYKNKYFEIENNFKSFYNFYTYLLIRKLKDFLKPTFYKFTRFFYSLKGVE